MRFAVFLLLALVALAAPAWAQDPAFTNRATDLRERGAPDARSLTSLPENTAVKVISRAGGWTQVDAGGKTGWVNAFHLRFSATVDKSGSSGGGFTSLTSMLGGGRSSQQATIATTGIRGLSPEDLKKASPDTAALTKAQSFRSDKPTAERFARDGKLASVPVEEGGRR